MSLTRRELITAAVAGALVPARGTSATNDPSWLDPYRPAAARLIGAALAEPFAWRRLAELTDTFGHRLSGSRALEDAMAWCAREMERDGLEQVRTEPVMVPRWIRGRERLEIVTPYPGEIVMLGLGDSIGTGPDGIEGELVVVTSFDDLEARAREIPGRLVLFDVPFTTYSATAAYRFSGPSRAGRLGAAAALVRSVGPRGLRTPHTGMLSYRPDAPRIPAAAITAEDAERLSRLLTRGPVRLRLFMEAETAGETESANLVAEVRGRERPDEVIVVGGHIDSWDVGTGAVDDAGGCIVTWEALRLMAALDLRPRRTVRVVLFTNEENGLRGALAYRDRYLGELHRHVLMLESDSGVFSPRGFGFSGPPEARRTVEGVASLLRGIGAHRVGPSGGGADIGPSVQAGKIPAMSLDVEDGQYFRYHHTEADTVDKLDPLEVARCGAAVAVMAWTIAELPERLSGEARGETRE